MLPILGVASDSSSSLRTQVLVAGSLSSRTKEVLYSEVRINNQLASEERHLVGLVLGKPPLGLEELPPVSGASSNKTLSQVDLGTTITVLVEASLVISKSLLVADFLVRQLKVPQLNLLVSNQIRLRVLEVCNNPKPKEVVFLEATSSRILSINQQLSNSQANKMVASTK